MEEPFGRQPKPVKITIDGESQDVQEWMRRFMMVGGSRGENVQQLHGNIFMIYPRAVNE